MIFLFSDFGEGDLYIGQVHAVLAEQAPGVPVIDLLHNAPMFDAQSCSYLLQALQSRFPPGSVFMAVVDPGVGGERSPLLVEADGKYFVGPDNGLFSQVIQRAGTVVADRILWRPDTLSASFHGRDLFAPVTAMVASGIEPRRSPVEPLLFPAGDLNQVIYVDHYGNVITGRFEGAATTGDRLVFGTRSVCYAPVFSAVSRGELFWYFNSIGLVEVAANQGSAAEILAVSAGMPFRVYD